MKYITEFDYKKMALWLLLVFITGNIFTQQLPIPKGLTVGKLDNGLTYYLAPEGESGKVKVVMLSGQGALVEKPEEHGFAHLLEHVMFNGSENYPGAEGVLEMRRMGMRPARDYNGYTVGSNVQYFMTIPENDTEYLKRSLLLLKDWMFHLSFDEEAFELEKKIVVEEINRGGTAASSLLDGTILEGHNVLGTKEGILAVDLNQLKEYYKNNYIPGKLALVVYGKIDSRKAKKIISSIFGKVPAATDRTPNSYVNINNETIVSGKFKPSQIDTRPRIGIAFKTAPIASDTYATFKQNLIRSYFSNIIKFRLQHSNYSMAAPSTNMGSIVPGNEIFNFRLQSKKDTKYDELINTFCNVLAQARQHGFLEEEIAYQAKNSLARSAKYMNDQTISLTGIQSHFLEGNTPLCGKTKYELTQQVVSELKPADFSNMLDELLKMHYTAMFDSTSAACTPQFNEQYILDKLANLSNIETIPFTFKEPTATVKEISDVHIETDVEHVADILKSERIDEHISTVSYKNGLKVVMHQTHDEKVTLKLVGKDGLNLIPEGDRLVYKGAIRSFNNSYSSYSAKDARQMERGLKILKKTEIDNYGYEIEMNGLASDIEKLFQIFHLIMTDNRTPSDEDVIKQFESIAKRTLYNQKQFDLYKKNLDIQNLAIQPDTLHTEGLSTRLLSYDRQLKRNLKNSIIIVQGDLPENIEELVSKYMGALISEKVIRPEQEVKQVIVPNEMVKKEFVWNAKTGKVDYLFHHFPTKSLTLKDELIVQAISQHALLKIGEIIREKYGLIYASGGNMTTVKSPTEFQSVSLRYLIDPENIERSHTIMHDEVLLPMSRGEISDDEVQIVKAMLRSMYVMSFYEDDNLKSIWPKWYLNYGRLDKPAEIHKVIKSITSNDIRSAMKRIIQADRYYQLDRFPKEK